MNQHRYQGMVKMTAIHQAQSVHQTDLTGRVDLTKNQVDRTKDQAHITLVTTDKVHRMIILYILRFMIHHVHINLLITLTASKVTEHTPVRILIFKIKRLLLKPVAIVTTDQTL